MQLTSIVAAALLAHSASAANLRFACSQLVVDRIDPLVDPGVIYSPHLHQITGGNSFNATMDIANDPATKSTCTSCSFAQDFSNYWTAVMFYKAKNGTYKRVPQVANGGPEGLLTQNGGLTVYYLYGSAKTTAFKKVCGPYNGRPWFRANRFNRVSVCSQAMLPIPTRAKSSGPTSAIDAGLTQLLMLLPRTSLVALPALTQRIRLIFQLVMTANISAKLLFSPTAGTAQTLTALTTRATLPTL